MHFCKINTEMSRWKGQSSIEKSAGMCVLHMFIHDQLKSVQKMCVTSLYSYLFKMNAGMCNAFILIYEHLHQDQ